MYHQPVLLHESIDGLQIDPQGLYVDATFGGGGHSRLIMDRLDAGQLFAFDQDEDALKNCIDDPRFFFIPQNFRYLKNFLKLQGVDKVDGILADLGVSSHQLDQPQKGFSTRFEGPLDMRMDQNNPIDAASIVNTYEKEQLQAVLSKYGELQHAGLMAADIVAARTVAPIHTTTALKQAIAKRLPRNREFKVLAQVFQALRIEVNQEMKVLEVFLEQCADVLKPGGRLVVISYHSLEDRLVKNYMRAGNPTGEVERDFYGNSLSPYKLITRKAVSPGEEEIKMNGRARSAHLRIAERM